MESMSGYGVAREVSDILDISIEISSVNSRFLDVYIRGVKDVFGLEEQLRDILQKRVSRGKLNVNVNIERIRAEEMVTPNYELLDAYHEVIQELGKRFKAPTEVPLTDYLRLPGALQGGGNEEISQQIKDSVIAVLHQAIDSLLEMRKKEGKNLELIFREYIKELEEHRKNIEAVASHQMEEIAASLKEKLGRLLEDGSIAVDRLYTELGIIAEKSDISEEITRLRSHLQQYTELLSGEKVGKQCKFLNQELHREVNTIGSKSISLEVTKEVIEMKTLIEKMREQIENVE